MIQYIIIYFYINMLCIYLAHKYDNDMDKEELLLFFFFGVPLYIIGMVKDLITWNTRK